MFLGKTGPLGPLQICPKFAPPELEPFSEKGAATPTAGRVGCSPLPQPLLWRRRCGQVLRGQTRPSLGPVPKGRPGGARCWGVVPRLEVPLPSILASSHPPRQAGGLGRLPPPSPQHEFSCYFPSISPASVPLLLSPAATDQGSCHMDAGTLSQEAGGAASGESAVMVVPSVVFLPLEAAAGAWGQRRGGGALRRENLPRF